MDLKTLQQRLQKYSEAKLVYKDQGEVSYIDYEGVRLSNKRYGPLWDLFRRYQIDDISEKDLDNIEILEFAEVEEVEEELIEEVEDSFEEVLDIRQANLHSDVIQNIGKNIQITFRLFNDHLSTVKGTIHKVEKNVIFINSKGLYRYIDYGSIVEYKFVK